MLETEVDPDYLISHLLSFQKYPSGLVINLHENDIEALITEATRIFMEQPVLLELEAPIKICGLFYLSFFY